MAGYVMFIYIAALLNIPSELVESAQLDGAGGFQIFRKVKFPLIMPAVTIGLFYAANTAFKVFDVNFALTNGGPANSTVSVAMDIIMRRLQDQTMVLAVRNRRYFSSLLQLLHLSSLNLHRAGRCRCEKET